MKRAVKIASDFGIDATVGFDAVRFPIGAPTIFDHADNSQEAFAFARAPELDAEQVDFDKLIARERALSKSPALDDESGHASSTA
jgi:hypothetical protein